MAGEIQPIVFIRCTDGFGPEDYRQVFNAPYQAQQLIEAANTEANAKDKVLVVKISLEDPLIYFPVPEEAPNDNGS